MNVHIFVGSVVFVYSRCRCTTAKKTNGGSNKVPNEPFIVDHKRVHSRVYRWRFRRQRNRIDRWERNRTKIYRTHTHTRNDWTNANRCRIELKIEQKIVRSPLWYGVRVMYAMIQLVSTHDLRRVQYPSMCPWCTDARPVNFSHCRESDTIMIGGVNNKSIHHVGLFDGRFYYNSHMILAMISGWIFSWIWLGRTSQFFNIDVDFGSMLWIISISLWVKQNLLIQ